MLQSLHIENVAVIEKADIDFSTGMTVLTGETGAGKSIVIDALSALLGERISRDVVRHGAEQAFLSAVFGELSGEVLALLSEQGYAPEEDGTLLIRRTVTADGKGSCRINGRPATVSVLRQLGRKTLVCGGDALNDLAMLDEADYAFCPADGTVAHRYPNVCPCGEGAVAEVIYKKIPEILDLHLDIR